jgi:phage gpG-like protein
MVTDDNRIPLAILGIKAAISEGMKEVHEETLDRVDKRWARGQDAMGNDWPPLDPSTIAMKGSTSILIDSGQLRSDVQRSSRYDSKTNTSIITSSLGYTGVHEYGMPERGIPARPFLQPAAEYADSQLADEIGGTIDTVLAGLEVD